MDTNLWVLVGVLLLVAAAIAFCLRRLPIFMPGKGIKAGGRITIGKKLSPSDELNIKRDRKTFSGPHGPGGGRDE